MLLELTIKNIALIESLRIEFAQGFNVLTGETGAGKSIVVDSVNLALGGRADREIIRTGAEKGEVQALFDITGNERAEAMARELGIDVEDGLLAVRRELSRSGRNVCRISGVIVPLSALRRLGGCCPSAAFAAGAIARQAASAAQPRIFSVVPNCMMSPPFRVFGMYGDRRGAACVSVCFAITKPRMRPGVNS